MVSVGPVQSYIIQARKVEDLVSASKIIQFMIEKAYRYIEKEFKNNNSDVELIYPSINVIKDNFNNCPNHFICVNRSETISEENMLNIIRGLRDEVFDALKSEFIKKFINKTSDEISIDLIKLKNHIRDTFYIYVVSEKFNNDDYEKAYKNLIYKLETLKNYRMFHIFEEGNRKCSICGVRQAVICKKDKKGNFPRDMLEGSKRIYISNANKLKDNEALCFSCALKRFINDDNIYSTNEIASLAWRRGTKFAEEPNRCRIKKIDKHLEELVANLKEHNGEDFSYKKQGYIYKDALTLEINRLKKEHIKEEHTEELDTLIFDFEKRYSDFIKSTDIKLSKFYALVKMDIDDLGKWLSGKYLVKANTSLCEFQKSMSTCLIDFAKSIENMIGKGESTVKEESETEKYANKQGIMVYAGGDDVMFFVPVAYLFDVLQKIDTMFKKKVIDKLNALNKDKCLIKDNKTITLSRSIVIAHYKTPLNKVLKTSFASLEEAKNKYKNKKNDFYITKNATAFTFITGSNSTTTTYFKNEEENNLENLQCLVKAFSKNLSKSFIHTLIQEFAFAEDKELQYNEMLKIKEMVECEIDRIYKRKWSDNDNDLDKETIIDFIKSYMKKQTVEINDNAYMIDFRNFFNMLYIAERLSREIQRGDNDGKEKHDFKDKTQ